MSKDNKRLGKGLEALFTANTDLDLNEMVASIETSDGYKIQLAPIDKIRANPFQPRKDFDETLLEELAASIEEHGIIQPLVVRKSDYGYDILAGERRLRAAKMVGLKEVPVVEKDFDDKQMMELAILENVQREDLNVIDEAKAYETLIEKFSWTQQILADRMGKSRSYMTNLLRLLTLPAHVQQLVRNNELSTGHAKVLVGLDAHDLDYVLSEIKAAKLSVRATEALVSRLKKETSDGVAETKPQRRDKASEIALQQVEEKFTEFAGLKTEIRNKKMTIHFENISDLNHFFEKIKFDVNN